MICRKRNTFEDVQQFYFEHATSLVGQSLSVMIIALNEEFSFGKERLNRLIERYMDINRRLNDYQDDARSEAEIRTRLEETGLKEFADFMLRSHDIKKYRQEIKQKNVVSIKEAAQAQEMLRKMKELM